MAVIVARITRKAKENIFQGTSDLGQFFDDNRFPSGNPAHGLCVGASDEKAGRARPRKQCPRGPMPSQAEFAKGFEPLQRSNAHFRLLQDIDVGIRVGAVWVDLLRQGAYATAKSFRHMGGGNRRERASEQCPAAQ